MVLSEASGGSARQRATARAIGGDRTITSAPLDLLAKALGQDTRSCVSVVDRRHVVVWANSACGALPTDPQSTVVGRNIAELIPASVAEERIALIDEAFETGEVVRVHGMLGGTWCHTAYHPFVTGDGDARVLVVTTDQAETHLYPAATPPPSSRRAKTDDWRHLGSLTGRERQVLRLLGFGLSTQDIADRLSRSVKTIQSHREALGTKLGVHNKSELARLAVCSGLTAVDESMISG